MSLAGFDVKMFSTNSRAWLVIGEFGIEKGSKTLIMCKGNAESLQFVPKKTEIIYDSTQYYIVDLNIIRQNNQWMSHRVSLLRAQILRNINHATRCPRGRREYKRATNLLIGDSLYRTSRTARARSPQLSPMPVKNEHAVIFEKSWRRWASGRT